MNEASQINQKQLLCGLFFVVGAFATLFLGSAIISLPFVVCLKFVVYAVFVNGLPGWIILTAASNRRRSILELILHSWVIGVCLDACAVMLCAKFQVQQASLFWPLLIYAFGAYRLFTGWKPFEFQLKNSYSYREVSLLLLVSVVVISVLMGFIARYPLDPHFHWMGSQSNSLSRGWPLEAPFIFGLNLYTHYLYNGYLYNVGKAIGLMPLELSATLSPVLHLFGLIGLIYDMCSKRMRAGLFALLAVALFFGCYGYDTNLWKVLHSGSIVVFTRVQSSLIGASLLMVLFGESQQLVRGRLTIRKWPIAVLLGFLLLIATGVRVQALPIFIFAMGFSVLVACWRLWRARGNPDLAAWNFRKRTVMNLPATIVLIGMSGLFLYWCMYFFFGRGQAGDPAGHLGFKILDSRMTVVGFGFQSSFVYFASVLGKGKLSVGLWFILILIGRISFMLPGAIAWVIRCFDKRPLTHFEVLMAGVYTAGVVSMVGLTSNVNEQWQFFFPADFAMAMMAAVGLAWLFRTPARTPLKWAVVLFMAIAAAIHVLDIRASIWRDEPIAQRLQYFARQRESRYRKLMARLEESGVDSPVVLVLGDTSEFDERRLSSNQHNVQLYGGRSQMNFVSARGSSMSDAFWRRKRIVNSPLDAFSLRYVTDEVRRQQQDPVIIVVGWNDPPCYSELDELFHEYWQEGQFIRVFVPKHDIVVQDPNATWWSEVPNLKSSNNWWVEFEKENNWWNEAKPPE